MMIMIIILRMTKNIHYQHQQQQEKYFIVDIRLQIMDMAVKSGV